MGSDGTDHTTARAEHDVPMGAGPEAQQSPQSWSSHLCVIHTPGATVSCQSGHWWLRLESDDGLHRISFNFDSATDLIIWAGNIGTDAMMIEEARRAGVPLMELYVDELGQVLELEYEPRNY